MGLTFFPFLSRTLLPADQLHGDDGVVSVEVHHPVRLIVVRRRQNAVSIEEHAPALRVSTVLERQEAESVPRVAIDSGTGWVRDFAADRGGAALYGLTAKGDVDCEKRSYDPVQKWSESRTISGIDVISHLSHTSLSLSLSLSLSPLFSLSLPLLPPFSVSPLSHLRGSPYAICLVSPLRLSASV